MADDAVVRSVREESDVVRRIAEPASRGTTARWWSWADDEAEMLTATLRGEAAVGRSITELWYLKT